MRGSCDHKSTHRHVASIMADWSRAQGVGEVLNRLEWRRQRPSAEGMGTAALFPPGSPQHAHTAPYPPACSAACVFGGHKTGLQSSLGQLAVLGCSRLLSQGFLESVLLIYGSCGLCKEEMAMMWHPTACSSSLFAAALTPVTSPHLHTAHTAFQVLQ